eukprot:2404326-Amphidinium_carterae.1
MGLVWLEGIAEFLIARIYYRVSDRACQTQTQKTILEVQKLIKARGASDHLCNERVGARVVRSAMNACQSARPER